MVYCGLYPSDGQNFEELRDACAKLSINDPSFEFEPKRATPWASASVADFSDCCTWKSSSSDWKAKPISTWSQTAPNVTYQILTNTGELLEIHNPQQVPEPNFIAEFRQPIVRVNFILPTESIGPVMQL